MARVDVRIRARAEKGGKGGAGGASGGVGGLGRPLGQLRKPRSPCARQSQKKLGKIYRFNMGANARRKAYGYFNGCYVTIW